MKRALHAVWFLAVLSMASVSFGNIIISTVGDGTGYDILGDGTVTHELSAYRSTNIAKTFDADGDNVYGTAGVFRFGDGVAGDLNQQPFTLHTQVDASFAVFSAGAHFSSIAQGFGQQLMDDPTLTPGVDVADMASTGSAVATGAGGGAGTFQEIIAFTIDATTPQLFRIGLIGGTQGQANGRWDPTAYTLSELGGASQTVTGLENNANGNANMVFFDVDLDGETSGTFAIAGAKRLATQGASLVGVTFDVIPEPSTFALVTVAGAVLLVARRRRLS